MKEAKKTLIRRRGIRGQGMTEYIIIVVAVALLSLAVVMRFGNQIRNLFIASSDELADNSGQIQKKTGGSDSYQKLDDINTN